MIFLLKLLGPIGLAAKTWIPGWSSIRQVLIGAAAVALFAVGMLAGAWANSWGEARRTAKERAAAVTIANTTGENIALKAAVKQQARTLEQRAKALEVSEIIIDELGKRLEERRNASPNPDDVVVPAGDPWLQRQRR